MLKGQEIKNLGSIRSIGLYFLTQIMIFLKETELSMMRSKNSHKMP